MEHRKIQEVETNYLQDITELKQVEATLRQTERTLTTLISNLPGFVYRCANDSHWTMSYISEGCQPITGFAPNDFIDNKRLSFNDIIHPDYQMWVFWQEAITTKHPFEQEYPIITASGETRWVWERGRGIFDDNGELLYLEGFITDITKRKEAEIRLAASEDQYRRLFELSPVAIIVEDLSGTILQVNSSYCQGSGYNKEELVGQNVRMFVPPENLPFVDLHIAALQAGATIEHEVQSLHKGGEIRIKMLRERAIPLYNGEQGILSLATDITDMKLVQESLLRSEKKYRSLVEHLLEGMIIVTLSGEVLLWNPAALKIYGIDPSDIASLHSATAFDFIHPTFVDKVREDMALITKGQDLTNQFQFLRRNGQVGWLEAHSTRIDYEGSSAAILVLMRDITELKQEQALKEFLSWHDALTNVYNRRYFEKVISENAFPAPSIIVADLDGLKLINDTLGHSSGDSLLRVIANILHQCAPGNAVVARIGGDEFVIITPYSSQKNVEELVRTIRGRQDDYNSDHPELPLSLSLGYAVADSEPTSLYDIFKRADNFMYRQKLFHRKSSRSALIQALMGALETKNLETREHVERLGELAARVARHIGYPESKIMELDLFAKFHDIGKVGVADSILNKPGPLTAEERVEMERHSEIGYRIASATPELSPIADLIFKHQEWWNGKGYPLGFKGTDIPIECRIVAIVDAYDAMTSDRPYRKAMSKDLALAELRRCAGTQFDPALVAAFLQII
ncbi:MAG: PAS/PAC sensor-containing diguanylate cyclase [Bacillota bacterium]|nr:MAG: PAS/PAC sensor-containing diguanylate cyclase [Bacillota bacterium]